MSAKKRKLGRGLDSLLPPSAKPEGESLPFREIPLAQLKPNLNQPRTHFQDEAIEELAASIKEKGVLQPLLVRKNHDHYEIIAGERRFRASTVAGLTAVPCREIEASDEASFEMALIENLQRENLNPMEEARAFSSLISQFDLSQEEAANRVGKKRSTVANALRLLNLPVDIQDDLFENRITSGHARAILSLPDAVKQRALRNMILAKSLSVRAAEQAARRLNKKKQPTPPKARDKEVQMRSLQEAFSAKIGLPVFIRPSSNDTGKIEITYQSLDDFELISDFFGVETS